MIVASRFVGDNDEPTMVVQHAAYPDALSIIVHGCVHPVYNAHLILDREVPEQLRKLAVPGRFDHRCLQEAHDHLAARWRYMSARLQPALPFSGHQDRTRAEWLHWLGARVAEWPRYNHALCRSIVEVLDHNQKARASSASERLMTLLAEQYPLPE